MAKTPNKSFKFSKEWLKQDDFMVQIKAKKQEIHLMARYKEYLKNPDSHPCYLNEWNSFYLTLHGELLKQGREANGYNYKPEWLKYWSTHIKELKLMELKEIHTKSNVLEAKNEAANDEAAPPVSLIQQPSIDLSFGESKEEKGAKKELPKLALYRRTQSFDETLTTIERSRSPQQKRSFTLDSKVPPSFDFHPSLCNEQKLRAILPRLTIDIPNPPELLSLIESASNSDDELATNNGICCMMAVEDQNAEKAKEETTADQPSLKRNHSEVNNSTDDELNPPKAITLPDNIIKNPTESNFNTQKPLPETSKQFIQAINIENPKKVLFESALKKLKRKNPSTSHHNEGLSEKSINDKKFFDYFKQSLDLDPKEAQNMLDFLNSMKRSYESSISVQTTTPEVVQTVPSPQPLNLNWSTSTAQLDNESIIAEWAPQRDTRVTLLTTALIEIKNSRNKYEMCRVILDSGSTSNLISKAFAEKLGIASQKSNSEFQSVGEKKIPIYGQLNLILRSRYRRSGFGHYQFFIIDEVYGYYPHRFLDVRNFVDIPSQLFMADRFFYEPRKVDALLGNGIVFPCFLNGSFSIDCGLTVKETKFGYTTGGTFNDRYMR